jgi:hypothetical protein
MGRGFQEIRAASAKALWSEKFGRVVAKLVILDWYLGSITYYVASEQFFPHQSQFCPAHLHLSARDIGQCLETIWIVTTRGGKGSPGTCWSETWGVAQCPPI